MGARLTLPTLRVDDPLWREGCRATVEVSSASFDEDLSGLGGSPYVGDMSSTGVRVPTVPTAANNQPSAQQNRYLIRLCGAAIPSGGGLIIHGIRQAATIRAETDLNDEPLVIEREITSPLWRFPDGNISWHLRHIQVLGSGSSPFDVNQPPGFSSNLNALDSAVLYDPPALPYNAPRLGKPPGDDIGDLGTWRDIRFPWRDDGSFQDLNYLVRGEGSVVLYASVHQPDPSNRANFPDVDGMRPEDRLVSNFNDTAIYGRVAGALVVELVPCCDAKEKRP